MKLQARFLKTSKKNNYQRETVISLEKPGKLFANKSSFLHNILQKITNKKG